MGYMSEGVPYSRGAGAGSAISTVALAPVSDAAVQVNYKPPGRVKTPFSTLEPLACIQVLLFAAIHLASGAPVQAAQSTDMGGAKPSKLARTRTAGTGLLDFTVLRQGTTPMHQPDVPVVALKGNADTESQPS